MICRENRKKQWLVGRMIVKPVQWRINHVLSGATAGPPGRTHVYNVNVSL